MHPIGRHGCLEKKGVHDSISSVNSSLGFPFCWGRNETRYHVRLNKEWTLVLSNSSTLSHWMVSIGRWNWVRA